MLPLSVRDYYSEKKYTLEFEYYYRHPRSYKRRGIFSVDTPAPTIRGVNRPKPSEYNDILRKAEYKRQFLKELSADKESEQQVQ